MWWWCVHISLFVQFFLNHNQLLLLHQSPPNQRFLIIESLKSPCRGPFIDFTGPIVRFLYITGPSKQLEGCRFEKEVPCPAGHPGRSTWSVSNKTHPFKLTSVHFKVWLVLPHYGDTLARTSEWLEGVLLWNTLQKDPYKRISDKTMPPHCWWLSDPLITSWKGC